MNHQVDHRDIDHRLTAVRQRLVVFAQAAVFAEPAEGAFDDPTFGQHHELMNVGPLDDFDRSFERAFGHVHKLACVAAVGPD